MYLGFGEEFFGDGNAPAINNLDGVLTLETMKELSQYMDPEYLVSDSTYVQKQFQQGKIAMFVATQRQQLLCAQHSRPPQ